ncbi:MAG: two-component regulator propeller domain-containing protein [Cyclobacteriaceae bacterium]
MAIKFLKYLVLFLSVSTLSLAGVENYNIKVYDEDSDFFGIFIYTIVQDSDGYLWIGTDEGLHQFDGKHLTNINNRDSTISDLVTAAVVPSDKGLLFGYFKGGLSRYRHGQYRKIFTENEVRNKIVKVEENTNGTYWVLTQNEGIIRVKNDDYRLLERSLLKSKISYDFEIFEDNLFLATNVGLIHYKILPNDKLKLVATVKGTEHIPIRSLFTDHLRSRHALWMGTEDHGLMELKLDAEEFEADKHHILKDMSILSIAEDDFDNLWVGTELNGLIKIDFNAGNRRGLQYTFFNKSNGFPGDQIRTVFVDRENEIWVGTFGSGLVQITEKNIQHYELNTKIRTGGINAIAQLNHTNLVLGTDNGLVTTYHTGSKDSLNFQFSGHLKDSKITSVFHSKFGSIWVGTDKDGIYKFSTSLDDPEKIDIGKIDGLFESVRHLTEDLDGNVWASLKGNGVIKIDNPSKSITKFNTRNGFYHNEVFHIFPDSQGRIWFSAHSVGVALMEKDGTIRYLTQENEIPVKDVNAITEDALGNIWLATYGQGLLKLQGNTLTRYYEKENQLLSDYCNSIAVDAENNIWVSHRKGVSHLNVGVDIIRSYNHKSELGESEVLINSTFTDDVGDIWFGNPYGLTKVDKPHINFQVKNLNSLITGIRLHYREEDLKQYSKSDSLQGFVPYALDFPYFKNDLTFDFIAIHLKDPDAVHYQFMLKGYDKEWSPIVTANEANYTNLPPGQYEFMVKESDNPNYWQEDTASLAFVISPAYWNTLYFTLVELGVMGIIITASFLISKRTHNRMLTKILLFASLFTVFEYVHTLVEPYVDDFAGGPAIFKVLINLILALALFPVENFIKYFLTKRQHKIYVQKKEKELQNKVEEHTPTTAG